MLAIAICFALGMEFLAWKRLNWCFRSNDFRYNLYQLKAERLRECKRCHPNSTVLICYIVVSNGSYCLVAEIFGGLCYLKLLSYFLPSRHNLLMFPDIMAVEFVVLLTCINLLCPNFHISFIILWFSSGLCFYHHIVSLVFELFDVPSTY